MQIWLRGNSLLDVRVHFNNGHDEIPDEIPDEISEEVARACAGIELWAPSCQDTVFISISRLCRKLKEKKFEEEARWLEENCSGTIRLKTARVNIFHDLNHKGLGG
ncbi:hypothetical protein KAU19_00795 [Candidatus Parcubacteria bacterium]|nr:hypothetical protein [Candidatus Parcubacteria bacterium]